MIKKSIKIILWLFGIVAVFILCLMVGRRRTSFYDVYLSIKSLVLGEMLVDKMTYNTIINIRMPRIILSMLSGGSLAISGAIYQKLFANPLATPDTLGVSSGASFGAALAILIHLNYFGIEILAFLFGLLAILLTYFVSVGKDYKLKFVILAGVMISSLFASLVSFIKYIADVEQVLPNITFWLMGSLSSVTYKKLLFGIIPMFIGIILAILYRYKISLLSMSESEIKTLGINENKIRILAILISTIMTAASVSLCGLVSFVGLVIPHFVKMIFSDSYKNYMLNVLCVGSIYLTLIDTICRSATEGEIPISILTSIIGVPFFIFIMRKSVKRQL